MRIIFFDNHQHFARGSSYTNLLFTQRSNPTLNPRDLYNCKDAMGITRLTEIQTPPAPIGNLDEYFALYIAPHLEDGDCIICDGNLDNGGQISENLLRCMEQRKPCHFLIYSATSARVQAFQATAMRKQLTNVTCAERGDLFRLITPFIRQNLPHQQNPAAAHLAMAQRTRTIPPPVHAAQRTQGNPLWTQQETLEAYDRQRPKQRRGGCFGCGCF